MKLNVVIMGQDCEQTIGMCLASVSKADNIIYCDGGSTDKTIQIIKDSDLMAFENILINKYDQEDKLMNGKQRNFYLKQLKKEHMGEWCLVLDADEVLMDGGIEITKQIISQVSEPMLLSPRIHHFVGDLGHEDATRDIHYVPNRLFKVTKNLNYPEVEHPMLQGEKTMTAPYIEIWHLRECLGVFATNRKHINNSKKSNIHNPQYLYWWNMNMLMGTYPRKSVYYGNLPSVIRRYFGI